MPQKFKPNKMNVSFSLLGLSQNEKSNERDEASLAPTTLNIKCPKHLKNGHLSILLLGLLLGRELHDEGVQLFGQALLVIIGLLGWHVDDLQCWAHEESIIYRLNTCT